MRSINHPPTRPTGPAGMRPCWNRANGLPLVLSIVLGILVLMGVGIWVYRAMRAEPVAADPGVQLSERTKAALKRLNAPLEIRFYAILEEADQPESLRDFAGRVDRLLAEYDRVGGGNITLIRHASRTEPDLEAADSDGITAFNLNQGEPCYLGLCVAKGDLKEALPRLIPEWEEALEADLTRAILRASGAQALADLAEAAALAGSTAGDDVKRAIPNFDNIAVENGRQILRDLALKELTAATTEMQAQVAEARQRLAEAASAGSESEQEAAMKQVQQAQAAQVEKLKEIAARLGDQITALNRLKGVSPTAP